MIKYKRYRFKRRVVNTKWVAHRNGWVNVDSIGTVSAGKDYWSNGSWKLTAVTTSGENLQLRVPRSVREEAVSLTKPKEVVSRYLKWVHATPESSETVNVSDPVTESETEAETEEATSEN